MQSDDKNYPPESDGDFYDFFANFIEKRKPRITIGTLRNYRSELSKIKKFRPRLLFSEITMDFIGEYEKYMLCKLNNKPNTVSKTLRKIKTVLRNACVRGKMAHDPFQGIRLLNEHTTREYLNWEELDRLEQLLDRTQRSMIKKVLRPFLFACYTGLRFQDVAQLGPQHIHEGMIILNLHKTRETVRIPLNKKAISLLHDPYNGRFFLLPCNGKTNLVLKHAMKQAGITKKVTFHVSRHTFATLSLNLGIPMEVVSRLLGHNDIQTTQIYAKVMDTTRVEMMKKWNEARFENFVPCLNPGY